MSFWLELERGASAGRRDHIPPVKRTFIYFSIDHEINSGAGWSICAGERWSGAPAFAMMDSLLKLSGTDYKIITMKNVGHDMLTYQGLNGANWDWPVVYWQWRKQPVEFMKAIVEWINKY